MGLSGTPTLILPDGELLPGYVPADRLKAMLDEQKAAAKR
jgi:thiol:disulfide interchange protein DsbC